MRLTFNAWTLRVFVAALLLAAGLGSARLITAAHADDPVAVISPAPDPLTFDDVAVGASSDQTLKIYSAGSVPLSVSSVTNVGRDAKDYQITSDGCTGHTIAPQDFCRVGVRFQPRTSGTRVTSIKVTGNACTKYAIVAGGGSTSVVATAAATTGCDGTVTQTVTAPGAGTTVNNNTTTVTTTRTVREGQVTASSACSSRRTITLHVVQPSPGYYAKVSVRVDGRLVKVIKGSSSRRIASKISLRGLPRKRVTVTIRTVDDHGRADIRTRHFVTCTPRG